LQVHNLYFFFISITVEMLVLFQDPSVQQAAGNAGQQRQGMLDDYNPFAEGNQTRPAGGVRIFYY
jgi:hypothetical protein